MPILERDDALIWRSRTTGSESDSLVRLAFGCGYLCLLLAAHLGIDDLVFRLGRTPHCQRYLDPCNASQMELYQRAVH